MERDNESKFTRSTRFENWQYKSRPETGEEVSIESFQQGFRQPVSTATSKNFPFHPLQPLLLSSGASGGQGPLVKSRSTILSVLTAPQGFKKHRQSTGGGLVQQTQESDFKRYSSGESRIRSSFRVKTGPLGEHQPQLIGGSTYARSLLFDGQKLTMGALPPNLKYLENVDHLFFKSCKKFPPEIKAFNPKEKRAIWNGDGRCVYYMGLTDSYLFKTFRSGFSYEIVDYLGRTVIISKGSQRTLGLRSQVTVELPNGFLLGTMTQDFFSSTYNIKDPQNRLLYTIQAPCYIPWVPWVVWCFTEGFEICMDDGISDIGKIQWGGWHGVEDEFQFAGFERDLGIEFDAVDDSRVKALIVGVYLLIEFQYFRHGGNGIFYFFFMLIGVLALSFVASNGFGFYPQINSPLVPHGEIFET